MRKLLLFLLFPLFLYPQDHVKLGIEALKDGFYRLSIEEFKKALSQGRDGDVRFLLGIAYFKSENYRQAFKVFRDLSSSGYKNPHLKDYLLASGFNLAVELVEKGEDERALKIMGYLLKLGAGGREGDIRRIMGTIYFRKGNYRKVIELLGGMKDSYSRMILAESYYRVGERKKANAILLEIVKSRGLKKKDMGYVVKRLAEKGDCGNLEELFKFFKDAVAYPIFLYRYSECLLDEGDLKRLKELLSVAEEKKVDTCAIYAAAGDQLFEEGRLRESVAFLEKVKGCKNYEREKLRLFYAKAYKAFVSGNFSYTWETIRPIYPKLERSLRENALFMAYMSGRNLGKREALKYLKKLFLLTENCTLLYDGLYFAFKRGFYREVASLKSLFNSRCRLTDEARYMIGSALLREGNEEGFSYLESLKKGRFKDLAVLEMVVFRCKSSPEMCDEAVTQALKSVKSPDIRKRLKSLR